MTLATDYPVLPAVTKFLQTGPKKMLINGERVSGVGDRTFQTLNPATQTILAEICEGDAEDIDRAVAAARNAFENVWSHTKPNERARLIHRLTDLMAEHLEELSQINVLDNGKTLAASSGWELPLSNDIFRYYAGMATQIQGETIPLSDAEPGEFLAYTLREPLGVVGQIIPWNYPMLMIAYKVSVALSCGNTVVLKPAEQTPLLALRFGELVCEAGFPPGVVNIVSGFGETAGAALSRHKDVDKVAFTGEHHTGRLVVQASTSNLKRVSLELGGKSPNIIFDDTPIEEAVRAGAGGIFVNQGQSCIAGSRLFVQRTIYESVVEGLTAHADTIRLGNGLDPNTDMGPLVSQAQLDRVTGYIRIGQEEGARVAAGGYRPKDPELADGFYIRPTVFRDVTNEMRIAQEEVFGPVVCVIPFDTEAEVVKLANSTCFGLGAGIWTRDIKRAHRLTRAIKSGMVWVNTYIDCDAAMPFGGYKMSGYGRECGREAIDLYTQSKAVWIKL